MLFPTLIFLLPIVSSQSCNERVIGRIVHFESLAVRGRWLREVDCRPSYKVPILNELDERDTYYTSDSQYKVTKCDDNSICLESIRSPRYYLAADYRQTSIIPWTIIIEKSSYPKGDDKFKWLLECLDCESLNTCTLQSRKYEDKYYMSTWHYRDYALYVAQLGHCDGFNGYRDYLFRVLAPIPTDYMREIYSEKNYGKHDQQASYSTTIGVSHTDSSSHEITASLSIEIEFAFKATASISSKWTTASSDTYSTSKTVTHTLTLPGRTAIKLLQLTGGYGASFAVGADHYEIKEIPLDGGPTVTRNFTPGKPYV